MKIGTDGFVGFGASTPQAKVHAYEDNANTGITTADKAQVIIEQDGAGDAAIQLELTGGQTYTFGIDNSVTSDPFVLYDISASRNMLRVINSGVGPWVYATAQTPNPWSSDSVGYEISDSAQGTTGSQGRQLALYSLSAASITVGTAYSAYHSNSEWRYEASGKRAMRVDYNPSTGVMSWIADDSTAHVYGDIIVESTGMTLAATGALTTASFMRASTAIYRRYYHLNVSALAPGASGATWVNADANQLAGWNLDSSTEFLEMNTDVHADWDAASDLDIEVTFTVQNDNSGGAVDDIVQLNFLIYYKAAGDTVCKTQTSTHDVTIGACAQWTQFMTEFPINYDEVDNVVEVGDVVSIKLNMVTANTDVADIAVNDASFYYHTTHTGIESGDS